MALVKHHVKKDVEILSDAGEWGVLEPDTPILKAADVEAWLRSTREQQQRMTRHGLSAYETGRDDMLRDLLDALRGGT